MGLRGQEGGLSGTNEQSLWIDGWRPDDGRHPFAQNNAT